ncbi:hypothetical protein Psal006b_00290 [Piscirickettsia salmonis]|uniref:Chitobiase n=1 Tax=Piscirickettsia salmonis TaxID=1238 RepID=A0A1L6TEZ3_PISSA|nr:hypothetical protein [Piscirickettsia salmonis]AKP72470.1 hypothetical protein PSLF89_300 [Piscirickettsia salmonis LF-89 = ATCC VR-1361]ALB24064.1 chitobiase [Piscirickettsia salmonis]ALY03876.1 hypothetical protein AWE47_14225 [Piscirickettsia salmonis]AMA43439.1 hypothetical protein AWJ11_14450 [Piscirickettsia salmonis]AOS35908.1 hypothetical protein AVM72_11565 [Piscirickettsia salmonis]
MPDVFDQKGSVLVVVVVAMSALLSLLILQFAKHIELTVKANQAGVFGLQRQFVQPVNISKVQACIDLKQISCEGVMIHFIAEDSRFGYYRLESQAGNIDAIFAVALTAQNALNKEQKDF